MNAYLHTNGAPVVEAQALNGVGVTATLRAAVSRILDNLKNNVETVLTDAPELAAPDMTAKSGVTSMSAGTPKLSMKTEAPPPAPPQPMTPAVFENAFAPVELEEDPFGAVAVAEPVAASEDDPFASPPPARAGLEELLASARHVVISLEKALDVARNHERDLLEKLREL
jgi:hypothetical protein